MITRILASVLACILLFTNIAFCRWNVQAYDVTEVLSELKKQQRDYIYIDAQRKFSISMPSQGLSKKWCFLSSAGDKITGNAANIVLENWYDDKDKEFAWIGIRFISGKDFKNKAKYQLERAKEEYDDTAIINSGKDLKIKCTVKEYDAYEIEYIRDRTSKQGAFIDDIVYISLGDYALEAQLHCSASSFNEDRKDFIKILETIKTW